MEPLISAFISAWQRSFDYNGRSRTPDYIRRLRDAGKPWPWIFISLIPIIGGIWLIYLLCQPSVLV